MLKCGILNVALLYIYHSSAIDYFSAFAQISGTASSLCNKTRTITISVIPDSRSHFTHDAGPRLFLFRF